MQKNSINLPKTILTALIVLLFCAGALNLSAQETAEPDVPLFEIAGVSITVDGKTREHLLEDYMEIKTGTQFFSREELDLYLLDKQVYLNNQRTFAEGTVNILRIEERADGPDLVYVDVWARDTWNIIALPYARFDSNEGLLISLRGRNYNFLGSMETLEFNLDYQFTEDENHLFSLNGDFSLPFIMYSRDWIFDIAYNVEYEETLTEAYPVYFNLDTDLGYFFELFDRRWRANLNNEYSLNDRDSDNIIADDSYLTSGLSVGGPVPTGLSVGRREVSYTPKLSTTISYVPGSSISEDRRGLSGTFSHSIGWGRVDWKGNFREGYKVSLSNSNSYNFRDGDWSRSLDFETEAFTSWGWGGLNSRLQGFHRFDGDKDNAGGPLRGILDDRIDNVESGAYLNLDFPFEMWIWFMSRWFEGHLSPFVDMALFRYSGDATDTDPFWYSGGIEAFAFPKAARSFYLRISAAVDLEAVFEDGKLSGNTPRDGEPRLELYIGLGHHY